MGERDLLVHAPNSLAGTQVLEPSAAVRIRGGETQTRYSDMGYRRSRLNPPQVLFF